MTTRRSKYRPRRFNSYVPAMGYSAEVVHGAPLLVNFGAQAVASTTRILTTIDATTTGIDTTTFNVDNVDPIVAGSSQEFPYGPGFGRCLQVVLSTTGAVAVNIYGRDYLGQPMRETFTTNAATPVVGVKAFKYIDRITCAAVAATLSVGTTDKLGLPYCMSNVMSEQLDGVRVATLGTLVTPSRVDPATATTTDPRGTYDPQSTLTGTAVLQAFMIPDNSLNAAGNGGLHGLPHYYA